MKLLTIKETRYISPAISFDIFWRWLDEEEEQGVTFFKWGKYPFNTGIRPKRLWSQFGRETLHVKKCEQVALRLATALKNKGCNALVAGHYGLSRRWMPPEANNNLLQNKDVIQLKDNAKTYLSSIMPFNFKGAILLESHDEIQRFLFALLAYPTIFSYLNLYLFSMTIPLVVEINHHADFFFIIHY